MVHQMTSEELDRACEWLMRNKDVYAHVAEGDKAFVSPKMIMDFKRYMENEKERTEKTI